MKRILCILFDHDFESFVLKYGIEAFNKRKFDINHPVICNRCLKSNVELFYK